MLLRIALSGAGKWVCSVRARARMARQREWVRCGLKGTSANAARRDARRRTSSVSIALQCSSRSRTAQRCCRGTGRPSAICSSRWRTASRPAQRRSGAVPWTAADAAAGDPAWLRGPDVGISASALRCGAPQATPSTSYTTQTHTLALTSALRCAAMQGWPLAELWPCVPNQSG